MASQNGTDYRLYINGRELDKEKRTQRIVKENKETIKTVSFFSTIKDNPEYFNVSDLTHCCGNGIVCDLKVRDITNDCAGYELKAKIKSVKIDYSSDKPVMVYTTFKKV
jgi:hypothetical protein